MSLADIYGCFNKYGTSEEEPESVELSVGSSECPSWEGNYDMLRTQPTYYRLNQYVSPYASSHWESSSPILHTMNDQSFMPPLSDKIDPNRIFSSDITALNATAADQLRTLKAFEKKFMESINDKNKYGLTEDDIAAFQAITAARNAITAINKEKVAVKKNIADIKIKQQQVSNTASGGSSYGKTPESTLGGSPANDTMVLDSIFDSLSKGTVVPQQPQQYVTADVTAAEQLLDDISNPNVNIQHERDGVVQVVVSSRGVEDAYFANAVRDPVSGKYNLLDDESNLPTATINDVDFVSENATDEMSRSYPVIRVSEDEI